MITRYLRLFIVMAIVVFLSGASSVVWSEASLTDKISRSDLEADIMAAFDEAVAKCKTYDDYEKLVSDLKAGLSERPDKRADIMNYAIARTRLEQLAFLSRQNDIESGRLYMNVNETNRAEAADCLDKASRITRSKDLKLDINFLKFLIVKDTFQYQKIDAFLDELAKDIASYSDKEEANRKQLARMEEKFMSYGMADYAMRLKIAYAQKVSPAAAEGVFLDIKTSADRSFAQGNMKETSGRYDEFIKAGQKYFSKEKWAAGIMEIAEKYFSAARYREARSYYEFYLDNNPESKVLDYCSYKIGMCYYNEKNYTKAMTHFEGFINSFKNSVWFDKAFEALCRLYFIANYPKENAISSLQRLVDNYYRKDVGDYALLLIAILYYNDHDYDKGMTILKKIPETSVYFNDADMLITDIKEIEREKRQPGFSYGTKDTYKVWEQYMTISSTLTPYEASGQKKIDQTGLTESGVPKIKVKRGAKIKLVIDPLEDLDRYANYQQDQEDISRLPRKLEEAVQRDLISINWSCDGGKFLNENQTKTKMWEAPQISGTYKVQTVVDDLGLVRKPDRGVRKDSSKELAIMVIVE